MTNYNELACMMATYSGLAVFKRFKTANVRNLLILQAEIHNLTHELGEIIKTDRNSDEEAIRKLEKSVYELQNHEVEGRENDQWRKIKEIRALLDQYNTALLQMRAIFQLPDANHTNLTALRQWLVHPSAPAGQQFLEDYEQEVWNEEHDLVSLAEVPENKDIFSRWFGGPAVSYFYNHIGHRFKEHTLPIWDPTLSESPTRTHLDFFPDGSAVVAAISTIFASILPTLSIFALYYIKNPVVRLGMIAVFTLLFSIIISAFANAKRSDCFGATAAFAAVLVVFVGSTDSNNCASTAT